MLFTYLLVSIVPSWCRWSVKRLVNGDDPKFRVWETEMSEDLSKSLLDKRLGFYKIINTYEPDPSMKFMSAFNTDQSFPSRLTSMHAQDTSGSRTRWEGVNWRKFHTGQEKILGYTGIVARYPRNNGSRGCCPWRGLSESIHGRSSAWRFLPQLHRFSCSHSG